MRVTVARAIVRRVLKRRFSEMRGILGFLAVSLSLIACAGPNPDIDGVPFCETLGSGAGGMGGSGGAGGGVDGGASCTVCPDNRYPTDGTRLKHVSLKGEDGSEMQYGYAWIDTAFDNRQCTFQLLPNGETRCVPQHVVWQRTYADPACTIPVYVAAAWTDCYPTPEFVRADKLSQSATCGWSIPDKEPHFYKIGAMTVQPTYYQNKQGAPGGDCWEYPIGGNGLFALDPAPDLNFFVKATIETPSLP